MDRLGHMTTDQGSGFPGVEAHPTSMLDNRRKWNNLDSCTGALPEGSFSVTPLHIEVVQIIAALC